MFDYNKIYKNKLLPFLPTQDNDNLISYFNKKNGWIYIAKSKDNTFLKIGRTSKTPMERAKTLSSTGVLNSYEIIFSVKVFNQFFVEKEIHNALKKFRISKEFFNTNIDNAIQIIDKAVKKEESILSNYFDIEIIKDDINLIPQSRKIK